MNTAGRSATRASRRGSRSPPAAAAAERAASRSATASRSSTRPATPAMSRSDQLRPGDQRDPDQTRAPRRGPSSPVGVVVTTSDRQVRSRPGGRGVRCRELSARDDGDRSTHDEGGGHPPDRTVQLAPGGREQHRAQLGRRRQRVRDDAERQRRAAENHPGGDHAETGARCQQPAGLCWCPRRSRSAAGRRAAATRRAARRGARTGPCSSAKLPLPIRASVTSKVAGKDAASVGRGHPQAGGQDRPDIGQPAARAGQSSGEASAAWSSRAARRTTGRMAGLPASAGRHRLDQRADGNKVRVQLENASRDGPAQLAGDVLVGADRVDVVREPRPVQHLPVDHARDRPEQQQQAPDGDGHRRAGRASRGPRRSNGCGAERGGMRHHRLSCRNDRQRDRHLHHGGRRSAARAAAHLPLPTAGDPRLPGHRRRRPDHLSDLHRPAAGQLPELRQGAGHLLPVLGLHLDAAQLDECRRRQDRTVPDVLPADRRPDLRAVRRQPLPAAGVSQHVRVLLHLLRGGALPLGPGRPKPAVLAVVGRPDLGVHQAAAGVLDPRRPDRHDRPDRRQAVGRRADGGRRARPCSRSSGSWSGHGWTRPTTPSGSARSRRRPSWTARQRWPPSGPTGGSSTLRCWRSSSW